MSELPHWTLEQLNIMDMGHTIQISGVIYADSEVVYLCMMPDEPLESRAVRVLDLDQEGWKRIIAQTDKMETEVLERAPDGTLAKVIIRKCTRQIEQGISWAVYRRDKYRCRYCGADTVPLTVDHLVLWEEGGQSIEENLVAACRKCNKARGRMQYEKWLASAYYKRVSAALTEDEKWANVNLVPTLHTMPRRYHTRKR